MTREKSREEQLISDLYRENQGLKRRYAKEKKRNAYLTRKLRSLKKEATGGRKVCDDHTGQKYRKAGHKRHPNGGSDS